MGKIENENIEIELLLEAIYQKYGYDFRKYSRASIKRRILHRLAKTDLDSVSEMQHRLLYDVEFFDNLLLDLSVNVTEMFRDPNFYLDVRKEVFPVLKTYPYLKIWHAGCATGEEVYSLAIMLREEGLYDRALIYATDFNEVVLKKAKQGIIPLNEIQKYTVNYQKVYEIICAVTRKRKYNLLEALAEDIVEEILNHFPQLDRIRVKVRKPQVPLCGILDYVEVTIDRKNNSKEVIPQEEETK